MADGDVADPQIESTARFLCVSGAYQNIHCLDLDSLELLKTVRTATRNRRVATVFAPSLFREPRVVVSTQAAAHQLDMRIWNPYSGLSVRGPLDVSDLHGPDVRALDSSLFRSSFSDWTPRALICSGDDKDGVFVSSAADGHVLVKLPFSGTARGNVWTLKAVPAWGSCGEVLAGGHAAGMYDRENPVVRYDLATGTPVGKYPVKPFPIAVASDADEPFDGFDEASFSRKGHGIVFASSRGNSVWLFSRDSGEMLKRLPLTSFGESLVYVPEKSVLLCGVRGGAIAVVETRMMQVREFKTPHQREIYAMARISDEAFVSVSTNGSVSSWTVSGKILTTNSLSSKYHFGVCVVDPDRRSILSIGRRMEELEEIFSFLVRVGDAWQPSVSVVLSCRKRLRVWEWVL